MLRITPALAHLAIITGHVFVRELPHWAAGKNGIIGTGPILEPNIKFALA